MERESILEIIAKRNGISVEQVETEIQRAIREAIKTSWENNDVGAMEMWNTITNGTGMCTAAELIEFMAGYVLLNCSKDI